MRMWFGAVVLVFGLWASSASAQVSSYRGLPPLENIVRQFQAMALVVDAAGEQRVFPRWSGPVRVGFRGSDFGKRKEITRAMADVARLTGLGIELAERDETANLAIWLQGAGCRTEFQRGYVIVGVGLRTLRHCLLQHLVHAVGPRLDACHARPSLFCPSDDPFDEFQPVDRIIITAAFDPRLKNGMSEAEVMPIARVVLGELVARWEKGERW